jgi:hypothetical protein
MFSFVNSGKVKRGLWILCFLFTSASALADLREGLPSSCDGLDTESCSALVRTLVRVLGGRKSSLGVYRAACKEGDAVACVFASKLFNDKEVTKKHIIELTSGCNSRDSFACLAVGEALREGKGVAKDLSQGNEFFKKACELGEGLGCYYLGYSYEQGEGVTSSYTKALNFYLKACESNYGKACDNAGFYYHNGRGGKQSDQKATDMYLKACHLSHDCISIGDRYWLGEGGVSKSLLKAREFFAETCFFSLDPMNLGCSRLEFLKLDAKEKRTK